ncbi:hypothetical protein CERSUDRAFT_84154 [Gelatoporia subvermispora B]|uniref:Uncharacterized protein n=1 Tax=Ceriporiopsis subvermispora (strain B) TaxID=914234 RepID=M2QY89_CERS8|nr:hypothetical protein CERSUDRAFT_84154 [Gelatoporia subvermispora B]
MARLYEGLSWDAGRDCVESVIEKDPYTSAVSVLYRLEKSPGDYRDLDVLTYLLNTESGRRSLQEVPNAAHILLQVLRAQSDDGVRTDDIPGFLVESVLSDLRQDACSQASLAVLGTLQQTGSVRRSLRNFPGAIEVLSAALRRQSEGTALENANVLPAVVITLTMDALKDEPYNLRYLDALMALHSTKHGLNALRARSDVIEPLFSVMLSLRQDVHDEAERLKVIRALVSILNDIAAFTTVNRQPAPSIYAVMPILLKGCEEDSAAAQLLMKQFISDMVMKPLEGHTGPVICIAFSRDGKCLASGSSDKTLRLWNTETGTLVSPQPVGHEDHVYCVAFSPTGRCVASGSKDHTIRLWDPETGPTPTTTFRGHSDTIFSISFSPDGRRLASASGDCTLRAWDVITGLTVVGPLEGHEATVESVSFSPDGHQIVSGSWDKTIRIWNADTGEMLVGPMQGHKESVFSVAFNPDGRLVASGSEDKTIRIWDAETGRQVVDPLRGHKSWVRSVAFSPDGNFVASGSDDKTVRLWDVSTGEMIAGPFEGHTDQLRSVVISPDGKRVASCSIDKTIRLWDATGHWPHEDAEGNGNMVSPYLAHAALVGLSKDAANRVYLNTMKRLESTVSGRRALRQAPDIVPMLLSILQTQSQVAGLDDMKLIPNILVSVILDRFRKDPCNEECIQALASIQGTAHGHIVLRERHDVSRMLSVVIQSLKSRISDKSDWLRTTRIAVDILNCTGFQALAGRHTGAEIRSFVHILLKGSEDDRAAARQFIEKFGSALALRPLEGHTDRVNSVVFSGDGTRIASGSYDKTLHIWDAATGTPVSVPFARCKICIYSIAFSPSGQLIVVCGKDNVIQLWDWEKEEAPRERFRGHTASVFCVAFSPDGKRVASGSADLTIRIWDVDTGQTVVGPIEAHTAVIESIAFSPDGCFLASGSRDKTIRVWNAHTGQPVAAPLEGHTESVFSVAFSLGSDRVISGSRDKTIRIWSVATARSVASPLKGHTDWVRCVAIAPNGKHIVSGSDDKTIRLWDVEAGAEIAQPFEGHTASVRSVAFSPDGRRVVSGSVDNTVRVWDVTREWIKWDADSEDELSENEVGLSVH